MMRLLPCPFCGGEAGIVDIADDIRLLEDKP